MCIVPLSFLSPLWILEINALYLYSAERSWHLFYGGYFSICRDVCYLIHYNKGVMCS